MLREKADDTNVRLSTVSQELEAVRQAVCIDAADRRVGPPGPDRRLPGSRERRAAGAPGSPAATAPPASACRSFRRSGCTTTPTATTRPGQYNIAIQGFNAFIDKLPEVRQGRRCAVEHRQCALRRPGKYPEAVDAYQKVIANYPQADSVADRVLQDGPRPTRR